MKKGIAILLVLALMLSTGSALAGWENSGGGWWYSLDDGGYLADTWLFDGAWYYFDSAGWMVTGWKQIGGDWYYFDDGAMVTGWKQIGGDWYYFDDGAMVTGTQKIGGTEYVFSDDGAYLYEAKEQSGWKGDGGVWYYISGGEKATGWKEIDGDWYLFADDGAMQTGWQQSGSDWFYLTGDGVMAKEWQSIGGKWYYFGTGGAMATGWTEIKNSWYYFDDEGVMQTGWLEASPGVWYYLSGSGVMVTGNIALDGKMEKFDNEGVWIGSEELKEIDLKGKTVYIYDWWSSDSSQVIYDELSEDDKARYDYWKGIEEEYGCTIIRKQFTDWADCSAQMAEYAAAGGEADSLALFIIEPGQTGAAIVNGIAAPWVYDFSGGDWNKAELDFATLNGKVYGVYKGMSEPRQMLFFNKRVLQEAGIDPNEIYDAQKNGTWTWKKLEEVLAKVARDTDNDGETDVFGLTGNRDDMYLISVFAGGGSFVDFDASGKLVPTVTSDATVSSLEWAADLWNTYSRPQPEGSDWNWYEKGWLEGNTAFFVGQSYQGYSAYGSVAQLEDDWGAVAFPVPTEKGNYVTLASNNLTMIPAIYDEDTNVALATIYDLYTTEPASIDADTAWIGDKYELTDERAVDETYAMLAQDAHEVVNKTEYLGNVNSVLGANLLWAIGAAEDVKDAVQGAAITLADMCDVFNESLKNLK